MTDEHDCAPRFRCVCGTEDIVTREEDGTLIDEMRCPGCDRTWRLTKLPSGTPMWSNQQTAIAREGDGPPVGQEPRPMPFPAPAPPTPHIKCFCGRHLDTRSRNGEPWHVIRCVGTYGCRRVWTLSDSYDGDGYVWLGRGSGGQRPWNAVRKEQNPDGPLSAEPEAVALTYETRLTPAQGGDDD